MYEEFTRRCVDLGIKSPTIDEYTEVIEPVYNYHPVFDGNFAKDRCAELYKSGGLGVFVAMREDADYAADLEREVQEKDNRAIEALKALEEAQSRMYGWRENMRKMWRNAEV